MKRRKSISGKVIAAAGQCDRCSVRHGLISHHITPLADGGTDDIDNCSALCCGCHREWHSIAEGRVPFTAWLKTPSAGLLLLAACNAVQDEEEYAGVPFGEVIRRLHFANDLMNSLSVEG
jgi:5-methylcytosine-specific restriction endonuclease McrA